MNLTLGTDAELVLHNNAGPVSAIGLIGGSKDEPFFVNRGNLQEDNVLAEFAINPVDNLKDWLDSINVVMSELQAKAHSHALTAKIQASARFHESQLSHPLARKFGCDPDYNAWTQQQNVAPDPDKVGNLRTCGGHIHVGWEIERDDFMARPEMIQWMDVFLGLPSVILDKDKDRRTVYGKAGAFRAKPYGVEYRVLSNFWLHSTRLQEWVYHQVHKAYAAFEGNSVRQVYKSNTPYIEAAINKGDADLATALMRIMKVEMP